LWERHWSEGIAKEAVWLSGVVGSFEEAEAVFKRVGHVSISDSSVWRRVETWGEGFKALEAERQQQAMSQPRGKACEGRATPSRGRMGVSMDGSKIHIRDEGWKELKVGCVFGIEVLPTWDRESQEWVDLAHALDTSYVAHLGGPEPFGQVVWAEAQQRGWDAAEDTQAIGDGAVWI
jgi:hypothetical protein